MGAKGRVKLKNVKDRISQMPDEILSFTLSLMPMREAAKTSILSRRWKYLWKTSLVFSSRLNLDDLAMRGTDYPLNMFRKSKSRGFESIDDIKVLLIERNKFVEWVNLILQLKYSPAIDSFRLRFYFKNDFANLIDEWINVAIAKRVPNIDIDLSRFDPSINPVPSEELYVFPSKLFTQETGLVVKRLCLNSCIVETLDFSCFRSIVDLKLEDVVINQENLVSFLSNCLNLENLNFVKCRSLVRLEISGSLLKLKYLRIKNCKSLRDIEIEARNLTLLKYRGKYAKFSFVNVPKLSNVIVYPFGPDVPVFLTNFVRSLSIQLPKLESLLLKFIPQEGSGNFVPSQLAKLRELVFLISNIEKSLWGYTPLIHASPYLRRLELHWCCHYCTKYEYEGVIPSADSPHLHLEEIVISGFTGTSHEIEFARYLLNNTPALKKMTIMGYDTKWHTWDSHKQDFYIYEYYMGENEDEDMGELKKKMEERANKQLADVLRPSVELNFI